MHTLLSRRSSQLLLLFVVFLGQVALAQPASFTRGQYTDREHGFRIKLPVGLVRMPIEKDRHGVVIAHFMVARAYPMPRRRRGYHPTFRVCWFPGEGRQRGALRYAGYEEYLRANLSGRLRFSTEKPLKIAGQQVGRLLVKRFSRATRYRLHALTYVRGNDKYVVEVLLPQAHADKLERAYVAALKSFRFLRKWDAKSLPAAVEPPMWRQKPKRWAELSAKQRANQRKEQEQELHRRVKQSLLPGWRAVDTAAGLLVTQAPDRYVLHARKAAVACRKFLTQHFDQVSDERVRRPVIRVFATQTQYGYYRARSRRDSHFVSAIDEICLVAEEGGQKIGQLADLHAGLWHHFLCDKLEHLQRHVPAWLDQGVRQYLRLTRLRQQGLSFELSPGEREEINSGRRKKMLLSVADLLQHKHGEQDEGDRNLRYQRGRLVRFMFGHDEPADHRFLSRYLQGVAKAQAEFYLPPRQPGAGDDGLDEAQTASLRKERDGQRKKLRERVEKQVWDWDAATRAKVEKDWHRFNVRI